MSSKLSIENITSGYRPIKDGREYARYFLEPNDNDRIIIEDGEVVISKFKIINFSQFHFITLN